MPVNIEYMEALFTYGTLAIPEIILELTGQNLASEKAYVEGYAPYLLKREVYPGLQKEDGATTQGALYRTVDTPTMDLIDHFEDEVYHRQTLEVQLADGGEPAFARVYVIAPKNRRFLSQAPWDRDYFEKHHMASYRTVCRAYRRIPGPHHTQEGPKQVTEKGGLLLKK